MNSFFGFKTGDIFFSQKFSWNNLKIASLGTWINENYFRIKTEKGYHFLVKNHEKGLWMNPTWRNQKSSKLEMKWFIPANKMHLPWAHWNSFVGSLLWCSWLFTICIVRFIHPNHRLNHRLDQTYSGKYILRQWNKSVPNKIYKRGVPFPFFHFYFFI